MAEVTATDHPSLREVQNHFAGAVEYAQLYEQSSSCARFFNERLRIVMEVVGKVPTRGKVLDLGCGPGILLSRMTSTGLEPFGVDCSPAMIAQAKKRTAGTNAEVMVGKADELPFEKETFDAVLALGVLEYIPDVMKSLAEIARVAKQNAVVVVSMLNVRSLYRTWERVLYSASRDSWLQRRLGETRKPLLHLHGRRFLSKMMTACHLAPVNVKYFDANVCVPPLDSEYPENTRMLNQWIDAHSGRWLSSVVHTAFILTALKGSGLSSGPR